MDLACCLGLLFFPLVAPSAGQSSAAISFAERGAPLAKVMPHLAQATNLRLTVSGALKHEVVCIAVHDVSVKALMDRLAQVTGASWSTEKDGSFTLSPSPAARAAARAADVAYRARLLSNAMAPPATKQKEKNTGSDEADASLPLQIVGLLRGIGVSTLAAIPNEGRVVFSTQPTATQEPLDGSAFDAFAQMAAEGAEAIRKQLAAADLSHEDAAELNEMLRQISNSPTKLLLIVDRYDQTAEPISLHVEFRGYDAHGKALKLTNGVLTVATPDADPGSSETRITLSHETRLFSNLQRALRLTEPTGAGYSPGAQAVSGEVQYQMAPDMRAEAMKRAEAPDEFDPLAYGDDLLIGLATARHAQLVACVPDDLFPFHHLADDAGPTPSEVLSRLQENPAVEVTWKEGWMCLNPRDYEATEAKRVDRGELGRLMHALRNDGYVKLDRVLELADSNMAVVGHEMAFEWSVIANPQYLLAFSEDWPTAELYGSLDEGQRAVLQRTHRLGYNLLSDHQAEMVRRMIYRSEEENYVALEIDHSPDQTAGDTGGLEDFRSEPTEVAPNGLPRDGYVSLTESTDKVIAADQHGSNLRDSKMSFPVLIPVFANRAARTLDPAWAPLTPYKTDRLRGGTRTTLSFKMYVAKDVFRASGIFGYEFPPDGTLTMANLPDDIKQAVDSALVRLKNRPPQPRQDANAPP